MRAKQRRTRVLASAAVVLLSALVPGPVSAVRSADDGPKRGARLTARAAEPAADSPTVAAPTAEAEPVQPSVEPTAPSTQPGAETESRTESARAATVAEDTDPATWVRDVDVLSADPTMTPGMDVPPPGDGPCPKATTCKTHVVRPARFKTDEAGRVKIAWRFNDEGRRNLRAPEGLLESAMRSATAEWSRYNSNVTMPYAGTTTATFGADGEDGSCADGTNTVTWHQFDPSVIAAVVTCTDPAGKTVRDVDLALNVTQHWEDIGAEADSRHTFDIRSIVTHELGHWLSLLDLYDGGSLAQTMMGNAEYGETRKRTLALGDIVGLQTVYPCVEGDSCPRKPVVDD